MSEKNLVRFDKEAAKRTKQEVIESEGDLSSKAVEVHSPGNKGFIRVREGDLIHVHTCKILDPDGEPVEYIIQAPDKKVRRKIIEILNDKVSLKILAICVNSFEEEFIWPVSQSANGTHKAWMNSGRKAIEAAQKEWVRVIWKGMNYGFVCTKPLNQQKFSEPVWSKLSDEELINLAFDKRIITTTDHEALLRHQGA